MVFVVGGLWVVVVGRVDVVGGQNLLKQRAKKADSVEEGCIWYQEGPRSS